VPPLRIVHELAHLVVSPPLPEAFDDVILEAESFAELGELLDAVERVLAAVEKTLDGTARLDP